MKKKQVKMRKSLTLRFKEVDGTLQTIHHITRMSISRLGQVDLTQRTGGPWPNAKSVMNISAVKDLSLNEWTER